MPTIEIGFAYYRGNGRWTRESKKFFKAEKAIKFIYMMNNSANMVYMELHCEDSYDDAYIRRKCKL